MNATLTIPGRYNGPPDSGNGGYSCGVLAAFIDGPARVRLSAPPPLDTALQVRDEDGRIGLYQGEQLVGSAVTADLELDVPPAPPAADARAAMDEYAGRSGHTLPTCYVCGPERPAHDGLELYTGPVGDAGMVACVWTPADDTAREGGAVRPEIVWAALDCPGYFATMGSAPRPALLGELTAELREAVPVGEELVVYAWPTGAEGRKLYAGSAIASASGEILACAMSTWILLRE